MTAYREGDRSAFERLVARHERPLWSFLRRFSKNDASAEDLLQEVFLRVVRSADEWRAEAKFSTWLYAIARNLCVDQARRAVHRDAASLDAPASRDAEAGDADLHAVVASETPGGELQAMDRELQRGIDRAVAALPAEQREVFLMREAMDLPFAEIARAVGVSEPTVKSRMRYALEKLRHDLAEFHDACAGRRAVET